MNKTWLCGRFELSLKRPLLMGVINITPDSFSDGQQFFSTDRAIAHGHALVEQGADILDLGAESTRPGAEPVSTQEELHRLLPVIEALRTLDVPLSVDTFKPEVMQQVLATGADIINDISGFRSAAACEVVAAHRCGLCVMHMQGEPRTMQLNPQYTDLKAEVRDFLYQQVQALRAAGVADERLMLDPGLGFGKRLADNYLLLRDFQELDIDGLPWLIGLSRKSMIGHVTGQPVEQRLAGSLAGMLAALERGAAVVRVHDVAESRDALNVWLAVKEPSSL